jgi:hypothetical protein
MTRDRWAIQHNLEQGTEAKDCPSGGHQVGNSEIWLRVRAHLVHARTAPSTRAHILQCTVVCHSQGMLHRHSGADGHDRVFNLVPWPTYLVCMCDIDACPNHQCCPLLTLFAERQNNTR